MTQDKKAFVGDAVLCTGLSAFWCPRCGDCTCERAHDGDCCFDDRNCPLHGHASHHAETIELAQAEQLVRTMALAQGVELTDHDQTEVSRFAQLLFDRARKGPPLSPEGCHSRHGSGGLAKS